MKKRLLLSLAVSAAMLAACSVFTPPAPKYTYKEPVASLRLTLLPLEAIQVGKPVDIDVKITNIKTLDLLRDSDLQEVHTQKIHLLAIDPTMTDYQHIHPEPTGTPGLYHFRFTPKFPAYRVWADVTPVATHQQEFAMANIGNPRMGKLNKSQVEEANAGGFHFSLTFDKPLTEGGESMGMVHITDAKGNNVQSLQPVMDAYGHLVGFYDDFRTVLHAHPMGDGPKGDTSGGPDLMFHLMPAKPGFIKLFLQVKINNKDLYVPFGVNVTAQK